MLSEKNNNLNKKNKFNKRYRNISKTFIIIECIIFLFFNIFVRCSCGIPFFNSIPPIIFLIIEIVLYFNTRNRVATKEQQKWMFIVYIILFIVFCICLVAIKNPHTTIRA